MENNHLPPIVVDQLQGQTVSFVGDTYRIVISGEQTNGAFAVMDFLIPPGGGPGAHSHADMTETFYIIDGEIEFRSEAGTYVAKKGSTVSIPKGGVVHLFKNKTDTTAHMLCMVTPAGLDGFFLELGNPVEPGKFLPPPEMTPEYAEKLASAAKRYGQEVFPPDFLDKFS